MKSRQKAERQKHNPLRSVDDLLAILCRERGVCSVDSAPLIANPPKSEKEFAEAILRAEGLTWPFDQNLLRHVRERVKELLENSNDSR